MNFTYYQYCLWLLGSVFLTANISVPNNALASPNSDSHVSSPLYLTRNTKSDRKNKSREYTFTAPDSKDISDLEQLTEVQGYKVEVYGSAEELLQQVKNIEPAAFIKGNIIQVGIFSDRENAEDLIRKLTVKGFWARIIVQ